MVLVKWSVTVAMVGFLAACQTTGQQHRTIADTHFVENKLMTFNRCLTELIEEHSRTDAAQTFGVHIREQPYSVPQLVRRSLLTEHERQWLTNSYLEQPYSASHLANRSLITEEERHWLMSYYLERHNCQTDLVDSITRQAPNLAEHFRRGYDEAMINLGDLLNRDVTIGEFLSRNSEIQASQNAKFKQEWANFLSGDPQRVGVPSARTKEQIQQIISDLQVEPQDMNFLAFTIRKTDSIGPLDLAIYGRNSGITSDQAQSAAQIFIKRREDTFVFRLFLRLPPVALRIVDAMPVEDSFYLVQPRFQKGKTSATRLDLGIVNLRQMERKQTGLGVVLDSGWIYAPGERERFSSWTVRSEQDQANFEANYSFIAERPKDRPIRLLIRTPGSKCGSGCKNGIGLVWLPASGFDTAPHGPDFGFGLSPRVRLSAQLTGDLALSALDKGEEIYRQIFAPHLAAREKRREILAWMKTNVATVSPDGVMDVRCGRKPHLTKASRLLPTLPTPEARARHRREVAYFNEHLACVRELRGTYDPAPYLAIYPQMERIMQEWLAAGGRVRHYKTLPFANYIPPYPTVTPENIAAHFERRLAELNDPDLDIKKDARNYAEWDRREAADRKRQAEAQRQARQAQARFAQQFIANQMRQNQQILDAVRPPQLPTAASSTRTTTTTTTTTTTETVTQTTAQRSGDGRQPQAQELPPLLNQNYYLARQGIYSDLSDACEPVLTTLRAALGGAPDRATCSVQTNNHLPRLHDYFCDAPEGSNIAEAYSAGWGIFTLRISGLTQKQRDQLYRSYNLEPLPDGVLTYHVNTTEIMAYRNLEDSWLRRRDIEGRPLYFRSESDLKGAVTQHCRKPGILDWDRGKRKERI